jgi:hypothetical protein
MRDMGWSWADLEATPAYVRRFCQDLLWIRRAAEADEADKSRREASRGT